MSVTVVIPNWNRADLLARVLDDLAGQTRVPDLVVVVDNGSSDESSDVARRFHARVISLSENRGFAAAVNLGIREARTEWVAVLNNDVRLSADWLEVLVREAEKHNSWFACGKILSEKQPELIDGTFDLLSRACCAWRAGQSRRDGELWNRMRAIHFAPFTAAIFRRSLFEMIGPLDEEFESYLEDVEFGLRCAGAGYGGIYVPAAVVRHQGSATLGAWNARTVRLISRNQLLLVARHYPPGWVRRYGWKVLVGQMLWGCVALRHGAGLAWLRGKLEGVALLRATARQHHHALDAVLAESEKTIRELQQGSGYDLYWKLYFKLT